MAFCLRTFCWSGQKRKRRKPKVRISGQRRGCLPPLPLVLSCIAHPRRAETWARRRNRAGGGSLCRSWIRFPKFRRKRGKSRKMILIVYFVDSRMIPLRPGLSALFVTWCGKRHRCPPFLPLGSKILAGRLGSFIFLLLGKLAALVLWAFVGRDVPIWLQFSAQAARYAANANISHVFSSSFSLACLLRR